MSESHKVSVGTGEHWCTCCNRPVSRCLKPHVIEITPELERRVLAERRWEARDRIADLERRLSRIAFLVEGHRQMDMYGLMEVYRIAKGK